MAGDKLESFGDDKKNKIDTSSPYYIHPSDYPKQMQQEMMNFLLEKNKMGFVDGIIEKPDAKYANTSSEIGRDLEERYKKKGAPRAYELKQTLNALRQGCVSVSTYYTKLSTTWDELQTVLPNPRCTCKGCHCGIGKRLNEVKEKERSYGFLMGLDDDFYVVRTQIFATKPTPSLSTIYHLVVESEQQRAITGKSKRTRVEAVAFQADYNGQRSFRQTPVKTNQKPVNKVIEKNPKLENERKKYALTVSEKGTIKKDVLN
ncbi:hypothetical protein Lser_V15G23906 [Lactuca serriola]